MLNENATGKVLHWQSLSCFVEEQKMDLLRNAAEKFEKLLSMEYYFEIARKNGRKEFVLNFLPQDFHHICGLHKLSDIGLVQTGARDRIYGDILNGRIRFSDIEKSSKADARGIPIMCCRSFFPMNQLDYTKNQPSYTLLKKIRTDTVTGERIVQYDRSKILDQAKAASSETERRSILTQLNEKRAQIAIRDVLESKREIRKDKQEHER